MCCKGYEMGRRGPSKQRSHVCALQHPFPFSPRPLYPIPRCVPAKDFAEIVPDRQARVSSWVWGCVAVRGCAGSAAGEFHAVDL